MNKKSNNSNKRLESTKAYIDALSAKYSKLNVVRVDLAYKKPYSEGIALEEVNSDIEHMFNNMRSKPSIFKEKVGHIVKREYTKDKGIHLHAVFIFDGQKVQKDAYKAEQIGKYWKEQITDKKGSYHNCHRNRYERHGIGMLDHTDSEKRKILDEDVLSYLCKDGQDIAPVKSSKKDRAFTRGLMPKSKEKSGRPRKEK